MPEGPYTKVAGVTGVLALVIAYLSFAAAAHLPPFHSEGNSDTPVGTSAATSPSTATFQAENSSASPSESIAENSSVPPSGPVPEYSAVSLYLAGFGCAGGSSQRFISVAAFTAQGPQATEMEGIPGSGLIWLDCTSPPNITFDGTTQGVDGQPTEAACLSALSNAVQGGMGVDVDSLKAGDEFCYAPGGSSNQLIFLRLMSVDQSSYDTRWSVTGWRIQ